MTLPELSRSGFGFTRIGADCDAEEEEEDCDAEVDEEDAEDDAGEDAFVAAGADCLTVPVEAGFVAVVVCTGFRTAGGGSSAGGGIGCGSGRAAPERRTQRISTANSIGR